MLDLVTMKLGLIFGKEELNLISKKKKWLLNKKIPKNKKYFKNF